MTRTLRSRLLAFALFSPLSSLLACGLFQLLWNSPLILYDVALVLPWLVLFFLHILAGQMLRRKLPRPSAREGLLFIILLIAVYAGCIVFFYRITPVGGYSLFRVLSWFNPVLATVDRLGFLLPSAVYTSLFSSIAGGLGFLFTASALPPALFLLGMYLPIGMNGNFTDSTGNDG